MTRQLWRSRFAQVDMQHSMYANGTLLGRLNYMMQRLGPLGRCSVVLTVTLEAWTGLRRYTTLTASFATTPSLIWGNWLKAISSRIN